MIIMQINSRDNQITDDLVWVALDDINTARISNEQVIRYAEVPKPYAVVISLGIITFIKCAAITILNL